MQGRLKPESAAPPSVSLGQYARYVSVGVAAFVATVAAREVFAAVLPADTPSYYAASIAMAYALGIAVNFLLQRAFTFRSHPTNRAISMFAGFMLVAVAGGLVTAGIASVLRYGFGFDDLFGGLGDTLAFVFATVCASLLTYWVNARWVFSGAASQTEIERSDRYES